MALPTHEQIMGLLSGKQTPYVPPKIVSQQSSGQKGILGSAIDFGKKYAKNYFLSNSSTALSKSLAETKLVQDLAVQVFPVTKAIGESVKQKSFEPISRFMREQALSAYGPRKQGETGPEYVERISMPALGFVGEGASVVKNVSSRLAKEATIRGVKDIIKKEFKNISDDVLERIAPNIAKSTKLSEIEKMLIRELESAKPSHAEIMKNLSTSKAGSAEDFRVEDPVFTEARKYKSAEEFVKAQGTPVYRGGDTAIDTSRGSGRGISVSGRETAELFTPPKGGIVDEAILPKTVKVLKEGDIPKNLQDAYIKEAEILADPNNFSSALQKSVIEKQQAIVEYARKNGFDAVEFPFEKEIRVVKPDILKTKSQLTDIWNKANGKGARGASEAFITSKAGSAIRSAEEAPVVASSRAIGQEIRPLQSATQTERQLLPPSTRSAQVFDDIPSPNTSEKLLQKSIEAVDNTKSIQSNVGKVKQGLEDFRVGFLEMFQNERERVRRLVQTPGTKVDDLSDPYLEAKLFPGRVGTAMERMKSELKDILIDIKGSNVTRKDISDYLVARHAPERNAALGDGAAGITTKAAQARLAAIEGSAQGAKIVEISNKIQEINKRTLDLLRKSQVITEDLYTTLKAKYKNHVPLNRIMEDSDDIAGVLSGKGFDVKSTGIRTAKGSQREVDDILGNVVHNYEQALLRAEKNTVDLATLNFVRKNKDILGDMFEVMKPKAIGKTFDGKAILEKTNDPSIIQMFENGKRVWIKVKDQRLATALKGVGRAKIGPILAPVAAFTRIYSGLMTRFNPEFAIPNKMRDLQEIAVYLSSQKGVGFSGAAKAVTRDLGSMADVLAHIRGKNTPGANLYKEMKEFGGTTGGMGLSTRKQTEINISKIEKLINSKTRKIADNIIEYVDDMNTLFEDSTRLSVYKEAISKGLSKKRAALLAKEASIDFNQMGTAGPVVNALWMFSNASIQGTVKMLRSLKNPKVLGAVSTTVAASVAAVGEWNDRIDPEWREKISKWDRLNSLPVMLPNPDGEGASYFTIPVSWGLKPIKVMADYAYDAASGENLDAGTVAKDLGSAILNAYNPVGGTDLISAVTPTILDTPFDIQRNVSWSGNKIRPDFDPYAPDDIQYYGSLKDTKTGQIAISISEMLNEKLNVSVSPANIKYAFEQYIGGAGKTVSKIGNLIASIGSGESPDIDEYPIVSRFYRSRTEEEVQNNKGTGAAATNIKNLLQSQSRDRFKIKNKAEELFEEYKKLPPSEANSKVNELKKSDPLLYAKLKETFNERAAGLSYTERLMKQLGVNNGERAKYVYQEILRLPKDKRNEYYADLKKKKIVTDAVEKQLKQLLKQ